MPIYEYDCERCGRFEVIQKPSEKPLALCPSCDEKGKKTKVTKAVSTSAFHLKGSGWYKTDYASSSSNGSTKKSETKSNEKSETKTESTSGSASATTETKKESKPSGGSCGGGCACH